MIDRDVTFDVLGAVRDLGLERPRVEDVRATVRAAIGEAIEIESGRRRRSGRRGRWPLRGSFALVVSTLVSIGVVVAAIVLLHHRAGPETPPGSAGGLIARLAVLRRPQTAADRLPAGTRLPRENGAIVSGLTRLVGTVSGARLFLVVTTPLTGSRALWSPRLGDQVSVVVVTKRSSNQSPSVPAADLSNGKEVSFVTTEPLNRRADAAAAAYNVGIVPDGVARVRWTLVSPAGKPAGTIDLPVRNNVSYALLSRSSPFVARATWYASDGHVIPTSDAASRHAAAARQDAMRAQAIRAYARFHFHADRRILAAFEVFSVTSPTGVRTASGLTITRPPLASLPFAVVNFADPRQPPQLDPSEIRQVTMPSGLRMWVIPGQRGLCVIGLDKPIAPINGGRATAGGEGCSANLAQTLSEGSGMSSGGPGGVTTTYRVVPRSHPTITIRIGRHKSRTFRPPYGVYAGPGGL